MQKLPKTPYFISYFANHLLINLKIKQENIDLDYLLDAYPQVEYHTNAGYIYITACLPANSNFLKHYDIAKLMAQSNNIQQKLNMALDIIPDGIL